MKSLRLLMILLACGATGTLHVAWAAEPAPANTPTKPAAPAKTEPAAPAAQPAAAESAAPKTDEDSKDEDGKEEGGAPAAAKPKDGASKADKASPQRFVPSEQVRADFDVSFPIDI